MENFVYNIPPKIYFGKGQIANLASAIKENGGAKVLLVYGGGSIKRNGIYQAVVDELRKGNIEFTECGGIKPNPRVEDVKRGIELYRANNLDFILGVGGGSVIDSCKAIAAGVPYSGDVVDLMDEWKREIEEAAPLGSVLTMAGTGSELNMIGVISIGENQKKFTITSPLLFPKFSILDPTYTYSVPEKHSMAGCFDALNHAIECYFSSDSSTEVQDRMNEGLMRAVIKNAPLVLKNPDDYDARANIMWASSMALGGSQFTLGKSKVTFPIHKMGHELSSLYDMTHGVTLAVLTPSWMRYTIRNAPEHIHMFAAFARNVFDVVNSDDFEAAEEGIVKLTDFIQSLKIPTCLKDAGVEKDKLKYLAEKTAEFGNVGALSKIEEKEALEIFEMAYE
ncbi:MAG: iron-containing alcohol dehydrogenase [Candidatus Thorarchaeota archaeon]|nr:iron-containing alcohol dehydrogenase [Candidatus Thorarchaeota archaeon]